MVAAVLAALAVAPARAAAQAQDDDPRPREAKAACAAGQVERGIAILADLFAVTNDVSWVYNQGRCYQQNGRPEAAINRFREYLRRADVSETEKRTEAQRFIEELEQELQEEARRAPAQARPDVRSLPAATDLGAAGPGADTTTTTGPAPPEPGPDPAGGPPTVHAQLGGDQPAPSRGLLVGGAALLGMGAVALAGGVASSLKVKDLEDETRQWSAAQWKRLAASQEKTATRYERLQWVGYGVAALALAGGGLCLFKATDAGVSGPDGGGAMLPTRGEARVWFAPVVQPGGGGGQLTVTF
jgi:hypothetical protein